MTKTVEAIYENGVLRPMEPLEGVAEHSKVMVTVEVKAGAMHPLTDCVGIMPDEDASEIRTIIEEEFERVDLDEHGSRVTVQRLRPTPG